MRAYSCGQSHFGCACSICVVCRALLPTQPRTSLECAHHPLPPSFSHVHPALIIYPSLCRPVKQSAKRCVSPGVSYETHAGMLHTNRDEHRASSRLLLALCSCSWPCEETKLKMWETCANRYSLPDQCAPQTPNRFGPDRRSTSFLAFRLVLQLGGGQGLHHRLQTRCC